MKDYRMPLLLCKSSMEHVGYYELREDGYLRFETHDRELAELLAECSQVFAGCTAEEIGRASEAVEKEIKGGKDHG